MAVSPLRLGKPPRELFALLHPAGGPAPRRHGVLLCSPFGQEAIRAHRLVRVLGDRLASAGFSVLRFDYFGTGDSDGDDAEGDLEAWIHDVQQADEALLSQCGVRDRTWIGLRLGASIAALASARASRPPDHLLLWDPIIDGSAYLEELADAHREALRGGAGGLPLARRLSRRGAQMPAFDDEALGFPILPALRRQIAAISSTDIVGLSAARITVVESGGPVRELPAHSSTGVPIRTIRNESSITWAADRQFNAAVVPADAMQSIVASLREGS